MIEPFVGGLTQGPTWCLIGPKFTPSDAKFHLVFVPPVQGPSTT